MRAMFHESAANVCRMLRSERSVDHDMLARTVITRAIFAPDMLSKGERLDVTRKLEAALIAFKAGDDAAAEDAMRDLLAIPESAR